MCIIGLYSIFRPSHCPCSCVGPYKYQKTTHHLRVEWGPGCRQNGEKLKMVSLYTGKIIHKWVSKDPFYQMITETDDLNSACEPANTKDWRLRAHHSHNVKLNIYIVMLRRSSSNEWCSFMITTHAGTVWHSAFRIYSPDAALSPVRWNTSRPRTSWPPAFSRKVKDINHELKKELIKLKITILQ